MSDDGWRPNGHSPESGPTVPDGGRSVAEVLKERGSEYGPFPVEAARMAAMRKLLGVNEWPSVQCHAGTMVLMKLCRLANSPTHEDSWRDIAGYAQLAMRECKGAHSNG